eukprot:1855702-Alexandrium_andersonii.AAC.1
MSGLRLSSASFCGRPKWKQQWRKAPRSPGSARTPLRPRVEQFLFAHGQTNTQRLADQSLDDRRLAYRSLAQAKHF